jgi:hypothetical protein
VAGSHVREHPIDETKTTIRKHHVVAGSTELLVSAVELDRLPTERWQDREAAALPEELATGEIQPTATEFPSAETTVPRSHVED